MRFTAFWLIIVLILSVLGLYVHRRASRLLGLGVRGRRALACLLAAGIVGMTTARLGAARCPTGCSAGWGSPAARSRSAS